jgi:pimeloyl-ACP methyl ester carboxylesterase
VLPKLIGYIAERRAHRERWVGALVDTQVPIRLINGLADPVSGAHMLVRYRELVAQPNIVELPGVGHYPQVEAPDAVVHAIRAHFTSGT